MDQITIGLVAPAFVTFPVWVAQTQGQFAQAGIEARTIIHGATDKVTDALRAGETQICLNAPEGVIADAHSGGSLRLIAGNTNRAPLSLIAQKEIGSIAELKGKRIGTSSLREGTAVMTQAILAAHGLRYPKDYELAAVGAHPQRWALLQEGAIDAALQLMPLNYVAEAAGFSRLAEASDYVPHYAFTAFAADDAWAGANRDLVVRMLRALEAATAWAAAHREETAGIIVDKANTQPAFARRGVDEMFDGEAVPRDLKIERLALEAVFDCMRKTEFVPPGTALSYEGCVDESYLAAV